MSKIRVIICRVDDETPEQMTEIGSYDMPEIAISEVKSETTLDALEQATHEQGNAILREVMQAQWAEIDEGLVKKYHQRFSPSGSDE